MARSRSVLVVGAGPTGLTAAIALRQHGLDVTVVDKAAEGANTSRAAVVHARTLEVLDGLGLAERILDRALHVPRFVVRDRAATLARLDLGSLPTPYPFTAMISQADTEALMRERLAEVGGSVRWGWALSELRHGDTGARVALEGPAGAREEHRVDLVVGADGMYSKVRQLAGIDFPGSSYADGFVLADVAMDWPVPRDTVSLTFAPSGLVVVAPLPGDRFRVVATLDDPPETPSVEDVERLLTERSGGGVDVTDLSWSGRFRVHHRLARHYRSGAVLLAGDAAHVHSPAGGQGMNTGIQDAAFLAACVVDDDLDSYERRRRPVARRVLRTTGLMTRAATLRSPAVRPVRNGVLRTASRVPPLRRRFAMELSGMANRPSRGQSL